MAWGSEYREEDTLGKAMRLEGTAFLSVAVDELGVVIVAKEVNGKRVGFIDCA